MTLSLVSSSEQSTNLPKVRSKYGNTFILGSIEGFLYNILSSTFMQLSVCDFDLMSTADNVVLPPRGKHCHLSKGPIEKDGEKVTSVTLSQSMSRNGFESSLKPKPIIKQNINQIQHRI